MDCLHPHVSFRVKAHSWKNTWTRRTVSTASSARGYYRRRRNGRLRGLGRQPVRFRSPTQSPTTSYRYDEIVTHHGNNAVLPASDERRGRRPPTQIRAYTALQHRKGSRQATPSSKQLAKHAKATRRHFRRRIRAHNPIRLRLLLRQRRALETRPTRRTQVGHIRIHPDSGHTRGTRRHR